MKNSKPIFDDKTNSGDNIGRISFANRKLSKKVMAQEKRKFFKEIDESSTSAKTKVLVNRESFLLRYVAASVVFLISLAVLFSYDRQTYQTSYGEVSSTSLPDGTNVTLNGNSSISYSYLYWQLFDKRRVKLKGEAFFEVVKRTSSGVDIKFQVITENLNVEVLGTKFNVIDRGDREVVVLEEGKVQVKLSSTEKPLQLSPGGYISYDKINHRFEQSTVITEGFTSWKDNYIVLDNKTLGDLAQIITTVYGKKVVFKNDEDKQIILQGKVPSDEIEVLVEALRLATKLDVSMKGYIVFIN